jgi:transcription antitermination factor NusG
LSAFSSHSARAVPAACIQRNGSKPCGIPLRRWFAVYTSPRHEKRVAEYFKVRQIEAFLPLYHAVHRWKNGSRPRLELPLFTSYIFVRMEARERVRVLAVPGVLSIVGSAREPTPLPDSDIETLRAGLHLREFEPYPYLIAGNHVRIKGGPLAGMEGVLITRRNQLRVVLTLDLIMKSVAVEVDIEDVELASSRLPGSRTA